MRSKASLSEPNSSSVRIPRCREEHSGKGRWTAKEQRNQNHADKCREEIQEGAPTQDQVNSILEYLGPSHAGSVIKDATGTSDALRKFKANESSFQRPITVDWNNGRAGTSVHGRRPSEYREKQETDMVHTVVGENESEILKLVKSLPKEAGKA